MNAGDLATLHSLLLGLGVTLQLAAIVLCIGCVGGVILGVTAAQGGLLGRSLTTVLLVLVRGLPLLVQVFIVYYLLPIIGLQLGRFATAILALGLFSCVTIGELVRGGISAVPLGQTEAASALGLPRLVALRLIVLPQVARMIIGPLVGQFVFLIKATSIISLLGVPELMLSAREVIERNLEGLKVMALVWVFYTAVCFPLSMLGRWIEHRLNAQPTRGAELVSTTAVPAS